MTYDPCAATDIASSFTIAYSKASGTTFPLGTTSVTCSATDTYHNVGTATFTVTVADTTPPTIVGSRSPANNANGWTNVDVTVQFTCADAVGPTTCTGDVIVGEGLGQSVTGTATDGAGNSSTATVDNINVDKTAPTIVFTGSLSYTIDQAVNISCTPGDALSGLASSTCPGASGLASTFTLGAHTLNATATDRAGNTTTKSVTFTITATFTSLCNLLETKTTNAGVAHSLCVKLSNASAAAARGSSNAAGNLLDAYQHELRAQSDKTFTAADAALLSGLADALR